MADQHEDMVAEFVSITGADPQNATHFLEASNWNLELASQQYFDTADGGDDDDVDVDDTPEPVPQQAAASSTPARAAASSSSSKPKPKPKSKSGSSRIKTLGDFNKDESDDEDDKQDFFAGGEKSGLAVQGPGEGSSSSGPSLINDILKRAAEGSQRRRTADQESEPASAPRFSGSGHTLGSDEAESVTIPDPNAAGPAPRQTVTRNLTFWRDGFSVEDGPLMRYDDPANREILTAIENGRAPLSLMNVEPGQPADVNVFKRLDEEYVQPKKKFVPFGGSGQRLGSVTPGEPSASASPAPAQAAAASAAAPATAPAAVDVDASAPTTNLQIRLGDGTRLVSRFNHTHTVGDIYGFVDSASVESRSRSYLLQTTFPNKELKEKEQTLKEAGLINAVVVQKWT